MRTAESGNPPPEGMDDFSKLTLLVLSIMKSDLERTGGGGLMFTR